MHQSRHSGLRSNAWFAPPCTRIGGGKRGGRVLGARVCCRTRYLPGLVAGSRVGIDRQGDRWVGSAFSNGQRWRWQGKHDACPCLNSVSKWLFRGLEWLMVSGPDSIRRSKWLIAGRDASIDDFNWLDQPFQMVHQPSRAFDRPFGIADYRGRRVERSCVPCDRRFGIAKRNGDG